MKKIIYLTLFAAIVSYSSVQQKIYLNAKANVGETAWAKDVDRQAKRNEAVFVKKGEWKCNIFVYEIILASGYDIGTPDKRNVNCLAHPILCIKGKNKRPYVCEDWYNNEVPGFDFIGEGDEGKKKCKPGDIITNGSHIGIIAGNDKTISAGEDKVVEGDWGYRGDEGNLKIFRYSN